MGLFRAPHRFLRPLSALYRAGVSVRSQLYARKVLFTYRSSLPVICVGNVTVGGSGKSPFVQFLARLLRERGMRPAILSRGYGGHRSGPHLVTSADTAKDVGDEALMHVQNLGEGFPVVIAHARAEGAEFIEDQQLADIILLDDGLQHHALARDMNILLLDTTNEQSISRWKNGRLLPGGWLREPLENALTRSECIVFTHKAVTPSKQSGELLETSIPQFSFALTPAYFRDFESGKEIPLDKVHGKGFSAFSSIAAPEQFFQMLTQLNFDIRRSFAFRDHHLFTKPELEKLFADGLPLICTEKDIVKIPQGKKLAQPILVLSLRGEFASLGARDGFSSFVMEHVARAKNRAHMSRVARG